jgi:hypothetical protein
MAEKAAGRPRSIPAREADLAARWAAGAWRGGTLRALSLQSTSSHTEHPIGNHGLIRYDVCAASREKSLPPGALQSSSALSR